MYHWPLNMSISKLDTSYYMRGLALYMFRGRWYMRRFSDVLSNDYVGFPVRFFCSRAMGRCYRLFTAAAEYWYNFLVKTSQKLSKPKVAFNCILSTPVMSMWSACAPNRKAMWYPCVEHVYKVTLLLNLFERDRFKGMKMFMWSPGLRAWRCLCDLHVTDVRHRCMWYPCVEHKSHVISMCRACV